MNRIHHFLAKNLDTAWLTIALAELSVKEVSALNHADSILLEAVKRSTNDLSIASSDQDVLDYLKEYDEDQISGLVSNIKGIYHELHFAKTENEDGDEITAELYEETNHEGFDIKLTNTNTGTVEEIQLKATDSETYIEEWIEKHHDIDQIRVTEEVAQKMDLQSSGISNSEITLDTKTFIEKAVTLEESTLWSVVPLLSLVSVSYIICYLYGMYKKGEITKGAFQKYVLIFSGKKMVKIVALTMVLSIPIVGQTVGTYLVYSLLIQAKEIQNIKLL